MTFSVRACSPLLFLALLPAAACDDGRTQDPSGLGGASGGTTGSGGETAATGGTTASGGTTGASCPEGAFVSLTYDDALPTHIANASPALDSHGFKGTFFLTSPAQSSAPAWRSIQGAGHELAAHTMKHPCPASNTWVPEGDANEDYDAARMGTELDDNIAMLESLGQTAPLTFAYPCGVSWMGAEHTSYVPLLEERFTAARGVVGSVITTLTDPFNVPAYFLTGTGAQLTAVVDNAISQNGWVVFGFHGVGGDHSSVALDAHEELLAHIEANSVPVLTFGEAIACKTK